MASTAGPSPLVILGHYLTAARQIHEPGNQCGARSVIM